MTLSEVKATKDKINSTVKRDKQGAVFSGKFCQILRTGSQNSTAHRGKIVQVRRVTMAIRL